MDLRRWLIDQDRPDSYELDLLSHEVNHYPDSKYRCPSVMKVFMIGCRTGFKLTDATGKPTEALRVMVDVMGAQLCQADGLPPEERRHFTDIRKGVLDPVFKNRWFIRNISWRLRYDSSAHWAFGWAPLMFKTDRNLGLMRRARVAEVEYGKTVRRPRYLAVCPPDWELTNRVYQGLCKWHRDHVIRRAYDCYDYLAAQMSAMGTGVQEEVAPGDGPAEVAAG